MRRLVIAVATLCVSAGLSQLPVAAQSEPENPVLEATPEFLDDPSAASVAEETLGPVQSDPAFDAATRSGEVQIVRGRTARATEPRETTTQTQIDPTGLTTPVAITRGAVSPRPPRAEVTEIVEQLSSAETKVTVERINTVGWTPGDMSLSAWRLHGPGILSLAGTALRDAQTGDSMFLLSNRQYVAE